MILGAVFNMVFALLLCVAGRADLAVIPLVVAWGSAIAAMLE